jgi:hypothetical protein
VFKTNVKAGGVVMSIHATVKHNNTTGRRLDFVEQQIQGAGRYMGQVVGIVERDSVLGGGAALIVRLCTGLTKREANDVVWSSFIEVWKWDDDKSHSVATRDRPNRVRFAALDPLKINTRKMYISQHDGGLLMEHTQLEINNGLALLNC